MERKTFSLSTYTSAQILSSLAKILTFAIIMAVVTMTGKITIPGTPVGITLQTLALMFGALYLTPSQAVTGTITYIMMGVCGLPVFAGAVNASVTFFSPSVGWLLGFIPGIALTSILAQHATQQLRENDNLTARNRVLISVKFFGANLMGCVGIVYACGIVTQAVLTAVPLQLVASTSMAFLPGDLIKAAIASITVAAFASRKNTHS